MEEALLINSGVDLSHFSSRQELATSYYLDVIRYGNTRFASQIFQDLKVFHDNIDINPFIRPTNVTYEVPEGFWEDLFKWEEARNPHLFKNYTHYIALDCFGRIRYSQSLGGSVPFFKSILRSTEIVGENISRCLCLPPFGRANVTNAMLANDPLGYRLVQNGKENFGPKTLIIGVLGGSFAASVYCIPGESFVEKAQSIFNSSKCTERKINIINLAMGSTQQGDSFSSLVNLGLIAMLDAVVWIDGLNDICCGMPLNASLGINHMVLTNVGDMPFKPQTSFMDINCADVVRSYIWQRKCYSDVLSRCGIRQLNILQPVCNPSDENMGMSAKSLLPFYDQGWSIYDRYSSLVPYIPALGESAGLDIIQSPSEVSLDFWDIAHLSPLGEQSYGEWLADLLLKTFG